MAEELEEELKDSITLKQEMFCQAWVDEIGNGTQAALIAFDIDGKDLLTIEEKDRTEEQKIKIKKACNVAGVMANDSLRNIKIRRRIDEIIEERGLNDEAVKREHFKLITQSKDEVKMRAIDSYYKLKGKIIDKAEVNATLEIKEINYIQPNGGNNNNITTDTETTPRL